MKTIPIFLFVAGVLAPALVFAQAPKGRPNGGPRSPERRGEGKREMARPFVEAWKVADLNHDGFISKEEFAALPRLQRLPEDKRDSLFKRLDKNGDERLSRGEIGHMGKNPNPPMQRLWELDVDKSGGISLVEFKAGKLQSKLPPEKQVALFRRLDTNKDGMISPKDKPVPPGRRDGDKNSPRRPGRPDGKSPKGQPKEPRSIIRQLDKNDDGALSFDEFRVGPAVGKLTEDEQEDRFEAMDRNHDKKITREDLASPQARDGEKPRGPRDGQKPPGKRDGNGPRGPGNESAQPRRSNTPQVPVD